MKKMIFALVAGVMTVTMMSCSSPEYKVLDEVVVYSYWTFSFGTRNDTLPGADPETFQQVKSWLGHDSEHVYFEDKLVPGVDVATLKAVRKPLFRDKNDYYYEENPVHVADMSTFKTLKWFDGDFWAKDSRYAYFDTTRIEGVDIPTFKVFDLMMARDKNRVYSHGEVIPDADPATFKSIGKSYYYRDKSHIWCGSSLIPDADYETFTVDDFDRAHDKYGTFTWEKRDTVETVEEEP